MTYKTFEEFMKSISEHAYKNLTPKEADHYLRHYRYWDMIWHEARKYPEKKIYEVVNLIDLALKDNRYEKIGFADTLECIKDILIDKEIEYND